jgi:hypothetical protein
MIIFSMDTARVKATARAAANDQLHRRENRRHLFGRGSEAPRFADADWRSVLEHERK